MAINHYPFAQATFLENASLAGRGGVCLELSRRWMKMRMPAELGCQELQQKVTFQGTAQEVFEAQKAAPWSRKVSGLAIEKTKQRTICQAGSQYAIYAAATQPSRIF